MTHSVLSILRSGALGASVLGAKGRERGEGREQEAT